MKDGSAAKRRLPSCSRPVLSCGELTINQPMRKALREIDAARGMQLPRQGKTILILGAAENCEPDLLLPDGLDNLRRMIVQQRNPRALQNEHIAACIGKQHRAQQHIAPGGKTAAHNPLIALALHGFHCLGYRRIGSALIAPAIGAVSIGLGALDRFQLP